MHALKEVDRRKRAVKRALTSDNPVVREVLDRLLCAVEMAHGEELDAPVWENVFLSQSVSRALRNAANKNTTRVRFLDWEPGHDVDIKTEIIKGEAQ